MISHLWILVSLQRSGSTWVLDEIARSDCVRADGEIFDHWDGDISHSAAIDAWTPAGRRAAVEGLMKLADGAFDGFDGPVSHRLEKWTRRRFEKSSAKGDNVRSVGFKWMVNQRIGEDYDWLLPLAKQSGIKLLFLGRSDLLKRAVSKVQNKQMSIAHARTEKQLNRLSHKTDMPTGAELIKLLDEERAALDELRGLWHRATDYGVLTKRLKYEELDVDHAKLDDVRKWVLGDLAANCPANATQSMTLKVHTGSVADHVKNWAAVRDTLLGTRYEQYLPDEGAAAATPVAPPAPAVPTHLWILISVQRSGTTWFTSEMSRSPCVKADHAIFDAYDDAGPGAWTGKRRAAVEGLMRLADTGEVLFEEAVPEKLKWWAGVTRDRMAADNRSRAPLAVGFKWMATDEDDREGQGLGAAFDDWLLPFAKAKGIKLAFLERTSLLRRAVSRVHNRATGGGANAHTRDPASAGVDVNFQRPAPSRRRRPRDCVCSMAWRFHAIDATGARWCGVHEVPRRRSVIGSRARR